MLCNAPAIISDDAMVLLDGSDVIRKRAALNICPPGDPERSSCLMELSDCLYYRSRRAHSLTDLQEAITLGREALELRPSGHPDRPSSLHKLGRCIIDRFVRERTSLDLEEAITLCRDALALCPPGHPNRSASLNTLAYCLREQFRKVDRREYMEEMIVLELEALELRPPGHPDRSWSLHGLAIYLSDRFNKDSHLEDLEEAITLERGAIDLRPPGHPERHFSLDNLATCLMKRYHNKHNDADLQEAITLKRGVLDLRPLGHPDRSSSVHDLAAYLDNRFDNDDRIVDLEEAITFGRSAVDLRTPGHSYRDHSLNNLASYLHKRYRSENRTDDLDEAVTLARAALDLRPPGHPDRSSSLHDLALYLSNRFNTNGQAEDLEEAITLGRHAVNLRTPNHPERHISLNNLANYLNQRYVKENRTTDLDEAITLTRAALALRPPGHPDQSSSLHDLAQYLSNRFDKDGQIVDLEEAITLGRYAVNLRTPGHPERHISLTAMANYLNQRYIKENRTADLDEAITLTRAALDLRPPGHPDRSSSLHDLALYLSNRFDKDGQMADLEEAITFGRGAVELRAPDHPGRHTSLNNLANYLNQRYIKESRTTDLDEAITFTRASLDHRPPGHPGRSRSLHDLALYLYRRFNKDGQRMDLEEAITLGRDEVNVRTPDHPNLSVSLNNLVIFLRDRYRKFGTIGDLGEIIIHRRAILELQPSGHSKRASSLTALQSDVVEMIDRLRREVDLDKAIALGRDIVTLYLPGDPLCTALRSKLASCLKERFQDKGDFADLDEFTELCGTMLEADPTDNHTLSFSLHGLALGFWFKSQGQEGTHNLDEAIVLERATLKLRRWGHPDRAESLRALILFLDTRLRQTGEVDDLEELIDLGRAILELCPLGHPDHASSLQNLAFFLSDRFDRLGASVDIEEAIILTNSALDLCPRGHPDRPMLLNTLMCYRRRKTIKPSAQSHPDCIKKLVKDCVCSILETFPPRLLNTQTGYLCDRDALITDFDNSSECRQLLSSAAALDSSQCEEHIHETVSAYFQYATLSHRWGKDEPLLRDVQGRPIYQLDLTDGLIKLQSFCATAGERGYLWSWSDTCCIDKDSTVELAKAIASMFSWYRRSALTIVYLADVYGPGMLSSSTWFERGWTLQELLAPRAVLFYMHDWSLYKECSSSNHKKDLHVLRELEGATGIAPQCLTNFDPGMDNARSRFQWASGRRTTEPEDIAYSLFGIFNVYLPIIPGESPENALGRLLAEIITQSGDISILSWVGVESSFHSCFPAHITAYRSELYVPSPPHVIAIQPSTSSPPDLELCEGWTKLFNSLSKSGHPQFVGRRLRLPCIMHQVTVIHLRLADPRAPTLHVYEIHAEGLTPLKLALSHELENISQNRPPYALIRPWHSKLLDSSPNVDSTVSEQLFMMLKQSFNALLLAETPQNEYKRIASSSLIVACPLGDVASIIQSKVQTVTIV